MNDNNKTKIQLIDDLKDLRRQLKKLNAEKEHSESVPRQSEEKYHKLFDNLAEMRVEEKLLLEKQELENVIDSMQCGLLFLDDKTRVIYSNKIAENWFGPFDKIRGESCCKIFNIKRKECAGLMAIQSGETVQRESFVNIVNGEDRYFYVIASPMKNDKGKIQQIIELIVDITERKRMEEKASYGSNLLQTLLNNIPDYVYFKDRNRRFVHVSHKFCDLFKCGIEDIIGKADEDFFPEEISKDKVRDDRRVIKTGIPIINKEEVANTIGGEELWVLATKIPWRDNEGNIIGLFGISRDISERIKKEKELREKEEFNFALFEYNPIQTIVVDLEGRIIKTNLAKKQSGDRLPNIGYVMYKDYAGKHEIDMYSELIKCIRSGRLKEFPEQKYGDKFLSITIAPFSMGAIITSQDITEQKKAEEEAANLAKFPSENPNPVLRVAKNSTILYANDVSKSLLDDWRCKVGQSLPDSWKKLITEATEPGENRTHEVEVGGRIFSFLVAPIEEAGYINIYGRDISKSKRLEEELRKSEERYALAQSAANVGSWDLDVPSGSLYWSDQLEKIFEFNKGGFPGTYEAFLGQVHPEDRQKVINKVNACLESGKDYYIEHRLIKSNGTNRWVSVAGKVFRDNQGKAIRMLGITHDITERKKSESELKSSQEKLRYLTAHLESVREEERKYIAREIHDEIGQDLTALKMDVTWLRNKIPGDNETVSKKISSMLTLIDTAIQTTKQISMVLRPAILDDFGLPAAIEWHMDEFQKRTGITCVVSIDSEDFAANSEFQMTIFRIFQEALTNIVRHSEATKVNVKLTEKAGNVLLTVKDNGIGITEEQISDSRNLGLLGMRERALRYGGEVTIRSVMGKGTTLKVSIPVVKD